MPEDEEGPSGRPKTIILDRKLKLEDLKLPRNQVYAKDLGECFKIFQKWGYDIIWVENGVDALRAVKKWASDIKSVMIEAYVPGGLTVARVIRFKPDCKHIPVFLMSSQLTEEHIADAKKMGVVDSLDRPFSSQDNLEERMQSGLDVQEETAAVAPTDPKAHILEELGKIQNLPAMPTVYNEIDKLSKNPETTTEEYAKLIELDPGITTQMLRLCNSSAFSFSRRITSVKDEVNLLGLKTVIDFVRTLSVVGAFKGKVQAFDPQQFWQHSIAVGVIGKLFRDHDEFKGKFDIGEEDPFMSGMVHDIGKLVLGYFFNEMYQMVLDEMQAGKAMYDVEMEVLGLSHANIGAGLAEKWQLPTTLSAVIGSHHYPTGGEANPMTKLIHLSDICSKRLDLGFSERQKDAEPNSELLEEIEMDSETFASVIEDLEVTIRRQVADTSSAIFK